MGQNNKTKRPAEKSTSFFDNVLTWEDFYFRAPPEIATFIKEESKSYRTQAEYLRSVFYELSRHGVTQSTAHRQNGTTRPTTTTT